MFQFKNSYFFVKPVVSYSNNDMEFEVYTETGELIGTNFFMPRNQHIEQGDLMEFGELLDRECQATELKIRFRREFGLPIENINTLSLNVDEAIDLLSDKYRMDYEFVCNTIMSFIESSA